MVCMPKFVGHMNKHVPPIFVSKLFTSRTSYQSRALSLIPERAKPSPTWTNIRDALVTRDEDRWSGDIPQTPRSPPPILPQPWLLDTPQSPQTSPPVLPQHWLRDAPSTSPTPKTPKTPPPVMSPREFKNGREARREWGDGSPVASLPRGMKL